MSSISIQTKKFGDLETLLSASDEATLLIHDGKAVKTITVKNLKKDLTDRLSAIDGVLAAINGTGAGPHNAIYRGKSLGTSVTPEQYAAIADGSFKDLYIGDYWTISGKVYRIAGFDYFYNCGDTNCTTHHIVVVPDKSLYNAQMHKTDSGAYEAGAANTTEGGYYGSDMYKTGLDSAKETIKAAFTGHILKHREYLVNAVTAGHPSGGGWFDSEVELMNENMVYGTNIFLPRANGSEVYTHYTVCKGQLPLFALRHDMIGNRENWWLRDVVSASNFAYVDNYGIANCSNASYPCGVRPAFCVS